MRDLTNAEEQIMLILWKIRGGFVRDVLDSLPEPKPAYNTISTLIRILEVKGFLGHEIFGKSHKYFPLIEKEIYLRFITDKLLNNYYYNSIKSIFSFFVNEDRLNLEEAEIIFEIISKSQDSKNKSH